jgi:hypothetical protein
MAQAFCDLPSAEHVLCSDSRLPGHGSAGRSRRHHPSQTGSQHGRAHAKGRNAHCPSYCSGPYGCPVYVSEGLDGEAVLADIRGHLDAVAHPRADQDAKSDGDAPRAVSRGIGVAQGVVVNVGVTIERLWVPALGHDGIRLQEAAQGGVIKARLVLVCRKGPVPCPGEKRVNGCSLRYEASVPSVL